MLLGSQRRAVSSPVLEVKGLVKVYGGTVALRRADLTVEAGEIHGLVGENGSGKSTMVRIIAGVERADAGVVRFPAEHPPETGVGTGVATVGRCAVIHQSLALIESLSVAENISLAIGYRRRCGLIDWRSTRRSAVEALAHLGHPLAPDVLVSELSVAQRAIVAIARAIAQNVRLLILDEPTATLQAEEARVLFSTMRGLRERGIACLLISHRIDEVLEACDRVTVLRDGDAVGTWASRDITRNRLVELMVGKEEQAFARVTRGTVGGVLLRAVDLTGPGIGPLSFDVRSGEVLAFTGRGGAGHLGAAELLFGVRRITGGSLVLDGRDYDPKNPLRAIKAGVSYVPADRQMEAMAQELTAQENLFMNPRDGVMSRTREAARAVRLLEEFDVRPPDAQREMSTFSGGNQQKVILAKWLGWAPKLLILAEPTAAVDIGAKLEIYNIVRTACAEHGTAVVLASSDFEEVALMADRVAILDDRRIVRVLDSDALTTHSVTEAVFA